MIQINTLERNSCNLSVFKEALKKTECGEKCMIIWERHIPDLKG